MSNQMTVVCTRVQLTTEETLTIPIVMNCYTAVSINNEQFNKLLELSSNFSSGIKECFKIHEL